MHFDNKDDGGTGGCDEVGNENEDARFDALFYAQQQSLTHKAETADSHHDEAGK